MANDTGIFNLRTIGAPTPWLVRTGAPEQITESGKAILAKAAVSVVIDLREPNEVPVRRDDLPIVNIPLYGTTPPAVGTLEAVYEALLRERGTALTQAVSVIADADGAALVHCTAGKDRTGLVVALARLAAGDAEGDVVDDYAASGAEVRPVRLAHAERIAATASHSRETTAAIIDAAAHEQRCASIMRLHLDSPPAAMHHALAVIAEWGGATEYLRAHGLTEAQLTALHTKARRAA